MGTKRSPGPHDCYSKAEPDEPIFVLLGRDPHAPAVVRHWATLRENDTSCWVPGCADPKVKEARSVAHEMEMYRLMAMYSVKRKLFVVVWNLRSGGTEILSGIHASLESAQEFCDKRSGRKNGWNHHDSHGECWVSLDREFTIEANELVP